MTAWRGVELNSVSSKHAGSITSFGFNVNNTTDQCRTRGSIFAASAAHTSLITFFCGASASTIARHDGFQAPLPRYRSIRPVPGSISRSFASQTPKESSSQEQSIKEHASDSASSKGSPSNTSSPSADWEDNPNFNISHFSELPHTNFGVNQHIIINDEFKEALRQILWKFRAPIRYAFAYGSGVFPQSRQGGGESALCNDHRSANWGSAWAVEASAPAYIENMCILRFKGALFSGGAFCRAQNLHIEYHVGESLVKLKASENVSESKTDFAVQTGTSSTTTSIHSKPPPAVTKQQGGTPKMIDFIFGVSYTEHWHSLNLNQHRDHYSALGSLGSGAVSAVQDKWGAGVYFNPFVTVNGTLIKYGVVNLDTLCTDLSEWTTLYLAGRLQKPVKILRDDPRVRLANQVNLLSALRTALLLLPPNFTELELYGVIANISYMGDPRMAFPTEDKSKVANIVGNNLPHFRRLYSPLIENLPNVSFDDPRCSDPDWAADETANVCLAQDMDPVKRGNMVRRLPKDFRSKLYFQYQEKYQIPRSEFNQMLEAASDENSTRINRRQGGGFEQKIANEPPEDLREEIRYVIKKTIGWPSTSQSLKGILTSGIGRSWRYMSEKMAKYREGKRKDAEAKAEQAKEPAEKEKNE
ncbi:MMP37-like protein [Drepanopeziza brunnea f. sp. 'multigermtubi' MB_m1]|uniref:Phosphatidate cytidylyltransferase, mitochondrial n=1 Tax=Marssonina brunnea f. sp. multigermtubi (strain MB_m1) TaxID=1072389 RepID=K1X132_MARBU|nr:MMP37-like protein [Drepanopeziza brunnea f. sp. 'multigermtubi' MB_m1]EKD18682.1 MMP37-like protein [Drepanopeziza brunnea f. sp. 'multigermtubi' MB_m1]